MQEFIQTPNLILTMLGGSSRGGVAGGSYYGSVAGSAYPGSGGGGQNGGAGGSYINFNVAKVKYMNYYCTMNNSKF